MKLKKSVMSNKIPIARAWVDSRNYLVYRLPIKGENLDKIEIYRPLSDKEMICLQPMILDAEIILCYDKIEIQEEI